MAVDEPFRRTQLRQMANEKQFNNCCCFGGHQLRAVLFGAHHFAVSSEEADHDKRKSNEKRNWRDARANWRWIHNQDAFKAAIPRAFIDAVRKVL